MIEHWRAVPGWEGHYEVSDQGRVRSLPRIVRFPDGRQRRAVGKVLTCSVSSNGYRLANLSRDRRRSTRTVHTLVLEAFVGPRPAGMIACHRDDDRLNNVLANLRWDTPSANNHDFVRNGRHALQQRPDCKRGHLLVAPNLRACVLPHRGCLACSRAVHERALIMRLSDGDASWTERELQERADWHYSRIMSGEAPPVPRGPTPRMPGHCSRNHAVDGANVVPSEPGSCRACSRARADRTAEAKRTGGAPWGEAELRARADRHYARLTGAVPQQRAASE